MKPSLKIPDSALLKASRKEVGQLTSEVDHLNQVVSDKDTFIKELEKKLVDKDKEILTSEQKKEIRQGVLYENLRGEITNLSTKVRKLKREKEDLQVKLINGVFN